MAIMSNRCRNMPATTIFSQPWWLDAVAPESWDVVQVEKGGIVHAYMPYVIQKRRSQTILGMPPLTQTLGPWLRPYPGKQANRVSEEIELVAELIKKLPEYSQFRQNFHHSFTNWLPFFWQGFQQTTRYTYVIEDLSDMDAVWQGFRTNVKRNIRKSRPKLVIRDDLGIAEFLRLNELTFKRQGRQLPYSHELVERVDASCSERQCRRILFAEDAQSRVHAAIYIVWDENAAYYLMGGVDPDLLSSAAMSLLMWEAINLASRASKTFDFEGSMIKGVERFFRSFGSEPKPYFQISKTNSLLLKVKQDARSWWSMLHD